MIVYILTIYMVKGYTVYGYKFLNRKNCEKVGKDLTYKMEQTYFTCKRKVYELDRTI